MLAMPDAAYLYGRSVAELLQSGVLGDNDATRRKMTAKLATLTRLARYDQLGIVTCQYVFYDGQPQADSAVLAGTPAIDAKEPLGKARNVIG